MEGDNTRHDLAGAGEERYMKKYTKNQDISQNRIREGIEGP